MIPVETSIQAIIFDCDGTLVDSMPIHMEAWIKAFHDFGGPYHDEFLDPLKGMPEEEIVRIYNQQFGCSFNPKIIVDRKHDYFQKKLHRIKPIQPVVDVVMKFADKLKMAVVSGGRRVNVLGTLDGIGIREYFSVILTADDPVPSKPAPDVFIEAARLLKIQPKFCQVFEDGDIGLEAARKAGMVVTDIRKYV